jgi:hypothetical protein
MNVISNLLIPSGARVSDWCFVGIPDSSPPIVKSFNLYETGNFYSLKYSYIIIVSIFILLLLNFKLVRLLGRGSFGDVNLVKSSDTNKL